jgi:hypothetical protein
MTTPAPGRARRIPAKEARERRAAIGVPDTVVNRLAARNIGLLALEKIARAGIPWTFIESLLDTPGLMTPDDVRGLITLWDGQSEDIICDWARVGSLEAAYRLDAQGFSLDLARTFPLAPDQSMTALVRMVQEARKRGMRPEDLLLWHTGGILSTREPWIDDTKFAAWRATGVRQIGMRRAALACAAGLKPTEAVEQVWAGTFDEPRLRLLAALRH